MILKKKWECTANSEAWGYMRKYSIFYTETFVLKYKYTHKGSTADTGVLVCKFRPSNIALC
jgi:hypothetical protein